MLNQVNLIGNVGQDPEIRTLESGKKVASLSLATSKRWRSKEGEKQEKTTWHNLVFFGNTAEVVEKYVKKGERISVTGEIDNRSYEDKEGNKRYISEIVVGNLIMLTPKNQNGDTDELPF